jgi:hypothetical protein
MKTKSKPEPTKKMLVVFDIDFTLLEYICPVNYETIRNQAILESFSKDTYEIVEEENGKKSCIIFRPFLKDVLEMIQNDPFFVPAIWTYGSQGYSQFIGNIVTKKFGLAKNFFHFIYHNGSIEDPRFPKSLHQIYRTFPEFNEFNTILIDDLHSNVRHKHNNKNSIHISPFTPFVEFNATTLGDTMIGSLKIKKIKFLPEIMKDVSFRDLLAILKIVKRNITKGSK